VDKQAGKFLTLKSANKTINLERIAWIKWLSPEKTKTHTWQARVYYTNEDVVVFKRPDDVKTLAQAVGYREAAGATSTPTKSAKG